MSNIKINKLQEELETILDFYFTEMPENESIAKQLLTDIDTKCNEIIAIDPYNPMAREFKFVANSQDFFFNTNALIENAEFIIEHKEFPITEKMEAYNMLALVYQDTLRIPDKAISVLEDLILTIEGGNAPHYEKASDKSDALNKIAYLYIDTNQIEKAIEVWKESYRLKSINYERNTDACIKLLELKKFKDVIPFLYSYHKCYYEHSDNSQLIISQKLKQLYDNNEISEYPELINAMFDLIRNNKAFYKIKGELDYVNQYLPQLKLEAERFKNHSGLWMTIADTHFFDLKDYDNAYKYYLKCMQGNEPNYSYMLYGRIKHCCDNIDKDFFALPFSTEGSPEELYNVLTILDDYYDEPITKHDDFNEQLGFNEDFEIGDHFEIEFEEDYDDLDEDDYEDDTEGDIRFLELAAKYGEACYNQYKTYFETGVGVSDCNHTHMFAMSCNNYGIVLEQLETLKEEDKYDEKQMIKISEIHAEGYHYSPFLENLEHQFKALFNAALFDKCIPLILKYEEEYFDFIDDYDKQECYWYLISSYCQIEDRKNIEETYFKAKKAYLEGEDEEELEDIQDKFAETAFEYYSHESNIEDNTPAIFDEVKWFIKENVSENFPFITGEVNYYLGLGYSAQKETKKALKHFEKSRKLLKKSDEEMHQFILEDIDQVGFGLLKNKVFGWFKKS